MNRMFHPQAVRFDRTTVVLGTSFWLALVLLAPVTSSAQSRSDTGRHKPAPAAVTEDDTSSTAKVRKSDPVVHRWHLGASGGVQGGSDLFRVEVINGPPVFWDPETGGGFQSPRFTASLDRNFSFGMFLARDLDSVWSVKVDMGYSRMDVAAEALVGQVGAVFLFDRFDVLNLGLGLEARLAKAASYPFVNASILVSYLGPIRADDLEQTNLGGRLGLGYYHSFHEVWGLRAEARLSGTGFSVGDYVPQSILPNQPEVKYDPQDHLIFFEFLIGFQGNI